MSAFSSAESGVSFVLRTGRMTASAVVVDNRLVVAADVAADGAVADGAATADHAAAGNTADEAAATLALDAELVSIAAVPTGAVAGDGSRIELAPVGRLLSSRGFLSAGMLL